MPDLLDAIQRGDMNETRAALAAGAKVNARINGSLPLDVAITKRQPEIAKLLLDAGADARKSTRMLCAAIELGNPQVVRALLDAGADPNMNPPGGRALQFAVKARSPEIVRVLIAAGADVNAESAVSSPLKDAVRIGDEECACLLIESGARTDADNQPPIAFAVREGQARVVEVMLRHGANPNCRGTLTDNRPANKTPIGAYHNAPLIHIAAGEGHVELVRLMLRSGADPCEVDDDGQTALATAERNGKDAAARVLRESGAADGQAKISPNLALLMAARAGDSDGVQSALAAGADINAQDARREVLGMTPLMLAAANGRVETVRRLLAAGAEPNAVDSVPGQKLPAMLRFAYNEGGMEAVEAMGVTLGRTALMYAASNGQTDAAKALLDAGADAGIQDAVKETAARLAKQEGHREIVKMLSAGGSRGKKSPGVKPGARQTETSEPAAAKPPAKSKRSRGKKVAASQLKRYESAAVRQRLSEKAQDRSFRKLVEKLAGLCGAEPVPLGDETPFGFSIHVNSQKQLHIELIQSEMLCRGAFVFAAHDAGDRVDRVGILPTDDKYDVLAAIGTNGANYDRSTADVIRWLMELEQEQPFEITGVEEASVAGHFTRPIADPNALAKSMYKFCPDIVDQGVGDVAALAETLREPRPRLYFWWD
jgi:ankyrin repeat protein